MAKYFFKMFRYTRPYSFTYWVGMIIYSSQNFIFPFFFGLFGAGMMNAILEQSTDIIWETLQMMGIGLGVIMVTLGVGLMMHISSTMKISRDFRRDLMRAYSATGIEAGQASHSGEAVAALNTEAGTAEEVLGNTFAHVLMNVVPIFGFITAIFVVDWRLGLGAVLISGVAFLIQNRFTKPLAKIGKEHLEANAASVASVSNKLQGAMTIRSYGLENRAMVSYDHENKKLRALSIKEGVIFALSGAFNSINGWMSLALVFGVGGVMVVNGVGGLTLASLMLVWPMVGTMVHATGGIGSAYARLQPPLVAAQKTLDRIDTAGTYYRKARTKKKLDETMPSGYNIKVNNLSFKFQEADDYTLNDISLEVAQDEFVAVIGKSGSGKSTLLRAIMGLYERDDLNITMGDKSMAQMDIHTWRKGFAYVDQACTLFDMSIGENIALGDGGKAGLEEVQEAAKRAVAHDFIMELDGGYDASAGEKGSDLSGGQRQRVAIARALVKKSPILIFDEATAALDAQTEADVMETILSLRTDNTVLMCTHNLQNAITADKIVVMDAGRVVEIGTHEELMAKESVYKELFEENADEQEG